MRSGGCQRCCEGGMAWYNGTTELSSSLLLALSVDEDVQSLLQVVSSLLPISVEDIPVNSGSVLYDGAVNFDDDGDTS